MLKNYINGCLTEGFGEQYKVLNPATNELLLTTRGVNATQIEEALEAAQEAFNTWSRTSINERIKWMMRLRDACIEKKDYFIDLLANEVGKSYTEAKTELESLVNSFNFYSEEVKRIYGTTITDYKSTRSDVFHVMDLRPLGVHVGHLTWNWPFQALGHKLAPTLASGCTCVMKPSIKTPMTAMALGEVAHKIGFPKGVFNIVTGDSSVVGKLLNESKIPRLISVIGSSETGRTIMNQAATSIKHFSFELGGNAPAIIMPDADLETAAKLVTMRKLRSCGQSCSSVNRVFVHESVHDEVMDMFIKNFKQINVGWGKDMPNAMGSQIDQATRDKLLDLINETVAAGADLVYGGDIPQDLPSHLMKGAFMTPTLLDKVTDDMRICNIEIFGPVMPVLTFTDLDDVIERANRTDYGLASYLFTHDARVIAKGLEDLDFGEVYVNSTTRGVFLPHCGIKESGIGCTSSKWSLEEYFHLKRFSIVP
jgi:succinate-semialdehyde dehydrogenase/glutarate-semialdehyde dehydrogenase